MTITKEFCMKTAANGFCYAGNDRDKYYFMSGNNRDGYIEVCCNKDDLLNGNIKIMLEKGLTRAEIR